MSTIEGSLSTIFVVLSIGANGAGAFIIGYALLLGTNDFQIGIISALPFALQIFQIFSAIIVQKIGGRRLFVSIVVFLARSVFVVLAVLPFVVIYSPDKKILILIYVLVFYNINAVMGGNAWTSWVGDLFPERIRGAYFGFRNGIFSILTVIFNLIGGLILDYFIGLNLEKVGFSILMFLAAMFGTAGALLFFKHPERYVEKSKEINYLALIFEPFKNQYFRKILVFFFLWNVGIGISSAFFGVHMIKNLHMSFSSIAFFQMLLAAIAFLSSKLWGKFIDRFGSKSVLLTNAIFICVLPIVWLFPTRENVLPVFLDPIISGVCWTGFNLAAFTFPIALSPKDKREFYLAVFGIVVGLGYLISSIIGGIIAQSLSEWHITLFGRSFLNLHVLFLISFVIRIISTLNLRAIKEPEERGFTLIFTFVSNAFDRFTINGVPLIPLIISTIPKKIVKSVEGLSEGVSNVVTNITGEITSKVDTISENISSGVENISLGVGSILQNLTEELFSDIENISNNILSTFKDLRKKDKINSTKNEKK
jgi:MFS family permease